MSDSSSPSRKRPHEEAPESSLGPIPATAGLLIRRRWRIPRESAALWFGRIIYELKKLPDTKCRCYHSLLSISEGTRKCDVNEVVLSLRSLIEDMLRISKPSALISSNDVGGGADPNEHNMLHWQHVGNFTYRAGKSFSMGITGRTYTVDNANLPAIPTPDMFVAQEASGIQTDYAVFDNHGRLPWCARNCVVCGKGLVEQAHKGPVPPLVQRDGAYAYCNYECAKKAGVSNSVLVILQVNTTAAMNDKDIYSEAEFSKRNKVDL